MADVPADCPAAAPQASGPDYPLNQTDEFLAAHATAKWPLARLLELRAEFRTGMSAGLIARRMGVGRNAVIGKFHRLGWIRPVPVRTPLIRSGPTERARERRSQTTTTILKIKNQLDRDQSQSFEHQPYADDPAADADIPVAQRLAFMGLCVGKCKWPVGDPRSPDFFFCGAPAVGLKPYCAGHWRRSYHLPPPRIRVNPATTNL